MLSCALFRKVVDKFVGDPNERTDEPGYDIILTRVRFTLNNLGTSASTCFKHFLPEVEVF